MAKSFGAQLKAWADKTNNRLEEVDKAFKLQLFTNIVGLTRVADPDSWQRPDPTYLGGTMRGNWQVTTDQPAAVFIEGQRNLTAALPESEAANIRPFSSTWLSNNTPYVLIWEENDAMVGRAIADWRRILEAAVNDADG